MDYEFEKELDHQDAEDAGEQLAAARGRALSSLTGLHEQIRTLENRITGVVRRIDEFKALVDHMEVDLQKKRERLERLRAELAAEREREKFV
jgi:chromosome segregation ATPase